MIGLLLLTAFLAEVQADILFTYPVHGICREETPKEEEKGEKKKDKPPPIPPLTAIQEEQARRYLNFMKSSNPEKRRAYEDKTIALGRGVLPLLLKKAETKHKYLSKAVDRCLRELVVVEDEPILQGFRKSKSVRLRRIAVAEYSAAARPKDREILKGFLKDGDGEVRLEAALGLVRLKDPSGIGEIILATARAEGKERKRILSGLESLKGRVYSSHFRHYATRHEDPEVRKAALEVIVAIGDRRVKDVLALALKDDHNLVKAAAVNALRKLIKNQPPVTFATVFDLVDAVEKWKKEMGVTR